MAITAYLKRNLSWLSVPFNGVMRSYIDDGTRTATTHGKIYWRYEDEPDMVPQFLADAEVGFERAVPFDSGDRHIRLFLIGFTELDVPTDRDFVLAEQRVVYMNDTTTVTFLGETVEFLADPLTFTP